VLLPPIRYVHTDDDVSLAYTSFGAGSPLLYAFAGPALSNFEHEWNLPPLVEQYEALARHHTVIRFDWRNCGLSTGHVPDVSVEAHLRDLLALQDHLGLDRVALRIHGGAPVAIRYAATHPDRVSGLVLSSPSVSVATAGQASSARSRLLSIGAETDWRLFARLFAVSLAGWQGAETAWFSELLESAEPDDFFRTLAAVTGDDVSGLLTSVECPVLIIQRREPPNYFFDEIDPESHLADSRLLTRDLKRSRLVILEGSSMMISSEPASTDAVLEFLRDLEGPDASPREDEDRPAPWDLRPQGGTVSVLGAVGFVGADGVRVELSSSRQRRLLAALATSGDNVVRGAAVGERIGLSGSALRTALSRLRSRIGNDAVVTEGSGYRVEAVVDASMFERALSEPGVGEDRLHDLKCALELWRGDALDEFRHESWAAAEAARLDELRLVAEEEHAELLVALGRSGEAISSLTRLVAANPYRDRTVGLLLQALAGEGRQADALRAYQHYRTLLADETGTEPSRTVQAIERRVASNPHGEVREVIDHLRSVGRWSDDRATPPDPG